MMIWKRLFQEKERNDPAWIKCVADVVLVVPSG